MKIKKFEDLKINELGPVKVKTDLDRFIDDFLNGLGNPFIMNMLYRMLDTNSFVKMGKTIYSFSAEELEKLEEIKPKLDELVRVTSEIKNIL